VTGGPPAHLSVVRSKPARILVVVTHLLGVGHLARAAALARALAEAGHAVTLVSGGRPSPLVPIDGVTFIQLRPVHCRGTDFRTLLDDAGEPASADLLQQRRERLLDVVAQLRPDVVITELFPFGRRQLADEFDAMLAAARALKPCPAVLASVRDILNPPSKPARGEDALERLGRFFDRILVHGDPEVSHLRDSWPCSPALEARIVDTGYVADGARRGNHVPEADPVLTGEILVSGGGGAAALPLYWAAIAAARLQGGGRSWRLLVGQGLPDAPFMALTAEAPDWATVERARPDFPDLLAQAALSVSQCGYNTMVDLAAARVRAVVVPFEEGNEAEQRLRADRFAALGLVQVVPQAALSAESLAQAVARALAGERPGRPVPGRPGRGVALDGAARTRAAVEESLRIAKRRDAARNRLIRALDAVRAEGRKIDVWWRDDDAVSDTPALRRLLALAERHEAPVALAVVPARADRTLAHALASLADVEILQHGYSHADHARPGEKKIELGGNSYALLVQTELETGFRRLSHLFGERFIPILVPPWNRIDPKLLAGLGELGFTGLSTFRDRAAPEAAPGLVQVNTHWDPIAWRAGGGLRDEAQLWTELAGLVEERIGLAADVEPLGLLTHHLVHDPWIWRMVEEVIAVFAAHPAARLRTATFAFRRDRHGSPGLEEPPGGARRPG
jgi:predicted glycosyltransferase